MQHDPDEATFSEADPELSEMEDLEGLKRALADEKKKAEEYLASWQRAQADFINYKRRTGEERQDFNRFANANLILSLLPVLDDLERSLDAISTTKTAKHDLLAGIKLVERKFKTSLEAQGVTPIKALGESFDPNFHEALRQDKGKEGIVIEEFQKGYMLGEKVLRPAKVVVGIGEDVEKEEN
ncbi:nucleotide exchange factor GrpE [Chloroflexota bacterium]